MCTKLTKKIQKVVNLDRSNAFTATIERIQYTELVFSLSPLNMFCPLGFYQQLFSDKGNQNDLHVQKYR